MHALIKKVLNSLKNKFLNAIPPDLKFHLKIPTPIVNEDRNFLEKDIFSYVNSIASVHNKLLFMGVGPYTWHYYRKLKYEVYTIDFDKERAKFGNKGKHTVGSVTELTTFFEKDFFKVMISNGLIGYGLNSKNEFEDMLKMCYECLTEDGILIIGYNNNPSHITFSLNDTLYNKMFDEYVPNITKMKSSSIEINSHNNHTFLFLRKKLIGKG